MSEPGGLESVAASAAEVQDAPMLGGTPPDSASVAFDVAELGDDCPVQPLGFLQQKFFFLDFAGQLIALGSEFRKGELMALFGTRMAWLENKWPSWIKTGEKTDKATGEKIPILEKAPGEFNQKHSQKGLILHCSKRGLFDPRNKVRGRGAHEDGNGGIVFHCGDTLLARQAGTRGQLKQAKMFKAGLLGGFVYPTAPKLPHPADAPASLADSHEVIRDLETWRWKRGEIDAYLLFCLLIAMMCGGALKIRPHGWIVGPSGAGKTTLQKFLQLIMDEWGVFTEDATEAGVRQLLDNDTLAVMFDEIEAEEDNQQVVMKIVRLARLAYSGASAVRGSTDHNAKQFTARSCFLFSSIHHHELPAQDRNRIAILHLNKFPADTKQFRLPATTREKGARLRRRIVEQWHRWPQTLEAYQAEMLAQGYTGREQDTYGTLLACGDLMLHDEAPEAVGLGGMRQAADRVHSWVKKLSPVLDSVRAEAIDTSERCIKHLMSYRLPSAGGQEQLSVSRWIQKAIVSMLADRQWTSAMPKPVNAAANKLKEHGLRLVVEQNKPGGAGKQFTDPYTPYASPEGLHADLHIAIAYQTHAGMKAIFRDTPWGGGNWNQPLKLVEGAKSGQNKFGGGDKHNCVLVPIEEFVDVAEAIEEGEALAKQRKLAIEAGRDPGVPEERG